MLRIRLVVTLLICSILYLPATNAASVKVEWGNVEKGRTVAQKIIGRDKDGFFVLARKNTDAKNVVLYMFLPFLYLLKGAGKDEMYIEKYNKNSNLVYSKEMKASFADGKKVKFEEMMMVDGQLLAFTSFYNKKLDKNFAFVSKVSNDGVVDKDVKQIDEISAEKKRNAGEFKFILSNDSSKILVYHNEPYEKNAQDRFSIKVMDNKLNTLWQRDISVPFRDKDFIITNYTVSNDNKVYMLARIQEGNRETKHGKPNYKYVVLSYNEKDKEPNEYLVSLGDKYISDITFEVDGKNNLTCAGFYSNKNSDGLAGAFFVKIDGATKAVTSKSVKDFDKKILGMFMTERRARKAKSELKSYDIRKLITKTDGGSVLVAEQYYVVVVTTTDSKGNTRTTYYYHYNDIIVLDITPKGEIGWVSRIPKAQVSANDYGYYSSFALSVNKDKINIIYNDNRKNENVYDPKRMRSLGSLKKSLAMLITVDAKGEYTKTALFNNRKKEAYIRPKLHLQTTKDELVMYGVKGRKAMFGTVKFN